MSMLSPRLTFAAVVFAEHQTYRGFLQLCQKQVLRFLPSNCHREASGFLHRFHI